MRLEFSRERWKSGKFLYRMASPTPQPILTGPLRDETLVLRLERLLALALGATQASAGWLGLGAGHWARVVSVQCDLQQAEPWPFESLQQLLAVSPVAGSDWEQHPLLRGAGIAVQALAAAPIGNAETGQIHGSLVLLFTQTEPFSNRQLHALRCAALEVSSLLAPAGIDAAQGSGTLSHAADELRAAELRYRLLFERNLAGVFRSTVSGKLLDCNAAFAQIFGYESREQVLRQAAQDFYRSPEHRSLAIEYLLRHRVLLDFEDCLRRRDGSPVWILENEMLVEEPGVGEPVILGTLIDISERKRAEHELRCERDLISAVVDNTGFLVVVLDAAGRMTRFNRGCEASSGFASEEMVGRSFAALCSDPARAARFLRHLRASRVPQSIELPWRHRSGETRRISWSFQWLANTHGELEHTVATGIDITEQRSLEEQLRQSQKMDAIGRLAGGIAHDFNNILTVISGHCDLLMREDTDQDNALSRLQKIKMAANTAAALTGQLLAFSRSQVLEPVLLDLNGVVREAVEMLTPLLGSAVSLCCDLAGQLGAVRADRVQIEQVLLNLAVNARDAMPQGGKLTFRTENVELDDFYHRQFPGAPPGPYVLLTVKDEGVGMDAATRQRVFEPFFTTKEQGRGTGLGLATVYGIVRQSGGHLRVESTPGEGSTFFVYLPHSREDDPMPAEAVSSAGAEPRGHESILLVEDEHTVRALARELLQSRGYAVWEASSADEALAQAEEIENLDLLLTDFMLPGLNGEQLAEEMRRRHPGLKVLFMSGYTGKFSAPALERLPPESWVQKPFDALSLTTAVRERLHKS